MLTCNGVLKSFSEHQCEYTQGWGLQDLAGQLDIFVRERKAFLFAHFCEVVSRADRGLLQWYTHPVSD